MIRWLFPTIGLLAAVGGSLACGRMGFWIDDLTGPWVEVGGSASGGGVTKRGLGARCKRVVLDRTDRIYIAWADDSTGTTDIYLRYWDGEDWASLDGSGDPGGLSQGSALPDEASFYSCLGEVAFDSQNRPFVAWMNHVTGGQPVYMRYWTGNAWEELGGSASAEGVSTGSPGSTTWWPRLVLDRSDRPVAAWSRGSEIYLRRFETDTWRGLGGSDIYPGLGVLEGGASLPALAVGAGEDLYVAWTDDRQVPDVDEVYLKRWNGTAWVEMGGSATGGGISATGVKSNWAQVAADPRGRPVVAWANESYPDSTIHLRRWDGERWAAFGGWPSLRDAGVAVAPAFHPSLALTPAGLPVVVWEEDDELGRNIHGALWDGSAWRSLDPVVEGGISATAVPSTWPSVDVATDGTIYVAWEEETATDVREVYLRELRIK